MKLTAGALVSPTVLGGRVIHCTALDADQRQFAVTEKLPVPPVTGKFCESGVRPNLQLAAAWVTVIMALATDKVPDRVVPDGFKSTENTAVPDPLLLAAVKCIQLTEELAAQP